MKFVGPVNSACTVHEKKVNIHGLKKKKRKRKTQYVDVGSAKHASQTHTKYDLEDYSNHAHNLLFSSPIFIHCQLCLMLELNKISFSFVLGRIKCVLFPMLGLLCFY